MDHQDWVLQPLCRLGPKSPASYGAAGLKPGVLEVTESEAAQVRKPRSSPARAGAGLTYRHGFCQVVTE